MNMESRTSCPLSVSRRLVLAAVFTCASTLGASAQQVDTTVSPAVPSVKQLTLQTYKLDLAQTDGIGYSSSVAPLAGVEQDQVATLDLKGMPDSFQPPPRRRYGRRRYNDSSHNPDGSNKYIFEAGVGLSQPIGNTYHYLNPSYAFQVGGGRNFNKNLGLVVQFDYDHFGFNGATITNQSNVFFGQTGVGLDGTSHVWSFTLNPIYTIYSHEGVGAYLVAGVGFYHKIAQFTLPTTGYIQDGFGNVYAYQANSPFPGGTYASNAPGFNGGFGITFKPSRFAGERFFAEARYVFVDNSQRFGLTANNYNTSFGATYSGSNFYPANSNRTTYIPIKFGIRF